MRIEILDLHAAHGTRVALDGITLRVESGELLALLGPSGSGKTTLLSALAGLVPCRGELRLDGRPARELEPRRRGLGMVFQGLALWPHLTVEGHLAFVLEGAGLARAERAARIDETLAALELVALRTRLPSQLSGGEAQRLALARALVVRPRALLLDEPFGSLDPALRERALALLAELHARTRATILLVTHDHAEALAVADRVAVIEGGRLLECGAPEELYRRPRTTGIARLTGPVSPVRGRRDGTEVILPFGRFPAEFGAQAGLEVVALLRPEDLRAEPGAGLTVRSTRFHAGAWRVECALEGGGSVLASSARRLEPGQGIVLASARVLWCVPGTVRDEA